MAIKLTVKLSIPTRFETLHKHYKECLEMNCSPCQNYLRLLVEKQQTEDCSLIIKDLKSAYQGRGFNF